MFFYFFIFLNYLFGLIVLKSILAFFLSFFLSFSCLTCCWIPKELPHLLVREIFWFFRWKNWTMILFHQTMDEDEIFWSPIHPMVKFPFELASNDGDRFRSPSIQWQKILPSDGGKILPSQWWRLLSLIINLTLEIGFRHHGKNDNNWFQSSSNLLTMGKSFSIIVNQTMDEKMDEKNEIQF